MVNDDPIPAHLCPSNFWIANPVRSYFCPSLHPFFELAAFPWGCDFVCQSAKWSLMGMTSLRILAQESWLSSMKWSSWSLPTSIFELGASKKNKVGILCLQTPHKVLSFFILPILLQTMNVICWMALCQRLLVLLWASPKQTKYKSDKWTSWWAWTVESYQIICKIFVSQACKYISSAASNLSSMYPFADLKMYLNMRIQAQDAINVSNVHWISFHMCLVEWRSLIGTTNSSVLQYNNKPASNLRKGQVLSMPSSEFF